MMDVDMPTQTRSKTNAKKSEKTPKRLQSKAKSIMNLPPPLVSPQTSFKSLSIRSLRFSHVRNITDIDPLKTIIQSNYSVFT